MEQKALFLDLDGTLLNDQKELTPGNRAAMDRALARGHKLIICTGRPLVSAKLQAQRLGLDGTGCFVVAYNGGMIYDFSKQAVIFQQTLPLPLVCAVMEEAKRRGIHIQTYREPYVLVEPHCDDDAVRRYCEIILMEHRVISDIHSLTERPVKLLAIDFAQQAPLRDLQGWLLERFGAELDCFFSCDYYLEIVPRGLGKGRALLQLSALLGIPQRNTLAAGDEANDISMLQAAGLGAAMCNGREQVKALADVITARDNNHDGVAWLIEKYML